MSMAALEQASRVQQQADPNPSPSASPSPNQVGSTQRVLATDLAKDQKHLVAHTKGYVQVLLPEEPNFSPSPSPSPSPTVLLPDQP